jgi:hypothetical protein
VEPALERCEDTNERDTQHACPIRVIGTRAEQVPHEVHFKVVETQVVREVHRLAVRRRPEVRQLIRIGLIVALELGRARHPPHHEALVEGREPLAHLAGESHVATVLSLSVFIDKREQAQI